MELEQRLGLLERQISVLTDFCILLVSKHDGLCQALQSYHESGERQQRHYVGSSNRTDERQPSDLSSFTSTSRGNRSSSSGGDDISPTSSTSSSSRRDRDDGEDTAPPLKRMKSADISTGIIPISGGELAGQALSRQSSFQTFTSHTTHSTANNTDVDSFTNEHKTNSHDQSFSKIQDSPKAVHNSQSYPGGVSKLGRHLSNFLEYQSSVSNHPISQTASTMIPDRVSKQSQPHSQSSQGNSKLTNSDLSSPTKRALISNIYSSTIGGLSSMAGTKLEKRSVSLDLGGLEAITAAADFLDSKNVNASNRSTGVVVVGDLVKLDKAAVGIAGPQTSSSTSSQAVALTEASDSSNTNAGVMNGEEIGPSELALSLLQRYFKGTGLMKSFSCGYEPYSRKFL